MGTYRIHRDANRSAVRVLGAAHMCPALGSFDLWTSSRTTEGQKLAELPRPEPPL